MGWAKTGEEPEKGAGGKKERIDSQARPEQKQMGLARWVGVPQQRSEGGSELEGGERTQRMEERVKLKKATAGMEIDFRLSQRKIRGQPRPVR